MFPKIESRISDFLSSFKANLRKLKRNTWTKIGAVTMMIPLVFSVNPVFAQTIDQINSQINQINDSLASNHQQQQTLQGIIDGINQQIQKIQLQIDATQAQIDSTSQQINDTNNQIAQTESDLTEQRKIMAEYLKTMYMEGQTPTMELILGSNSFSDFVDKDQYVSTMQQKVKATEDKIANLEKQLKQKKADLDAEQKKNQELQASQVAQKDAVVTQQNYENSLLANAQAQATALNNKKDALYAQKAQMSAAYGESTQNGSSAYPYGNPPAAYRIDAPDAYGYLIGECTSYVAWKRASVGRPVPRAMGNGGQWAATASRLGMSVDSTPRVGDAMVFPYISAYGHVAYVEAVYGNGTILISEYNWTPYRFDERVVNPYNYGALFIH